MHNLAGEFTIAKWEEKRFLDVKGPAKANEAEIVYSVGGDLTGALKGKYILTYQTEKQATYCGALQFEGKIRNRAGSFFLQETGTFGNDLARSSWTIINGSGTEDLTGIGGTGHYTATTNGKVTFELEVSGVDLL